MVDRKRVMVFADDDNAIDCKSHFEYIAHKIDFTAEGFVNAVEEAIALKLEAFNGNAPKKSTPKVTKKSAPVVVEPEDVVEDDEDTPPFDVDDDLDAELEVDFDALRTEIRNKNKAGTAEQKKAVKAIIASTGMKLDEIEDVNVLTQILEIFE